MGHRHSLGHTGRQSGPRDAHQQLLVDGALALKFTLNVHRLLVQTGVLDLEVLDAAHS